MLSIQGAILLCLVGYSAAQNQDSYEYNGLQQRPIPPAILMHKQALSQDGNFNFVFTAENGLKQGETIAPDGTRTGGYEYVDPSGKTISVKYTAGKDGFRILEGDHVPRPYPQQQIVPQSQPRYHTGQYTAQPKYQEYDDGSYHPSQHEQKYTPTFHHRPAPAFHRSHDDSKSRSVDYDYKEDDQHKGPHSFGSGYAFEFQG